MLLRHTTSAVKERKALTVNPAKTCQPIGAMYAALGVHGCLPHSHGSQGCCAYHRSALTRHYKEPIMAATSSFTEGSSVFGGQANLLQSINNIFSIYEPEIIAVHTTCLSETIGDDIPQIVNKAEADGKVPEGKKVIHCNTPSYVGSHITGFSNMVKGLVEYFAEPSTTKNQKVNIIPGWMEPCDYREVKRLTAMMGVESIMFPDTSDVLDAPMTGKHEFYPKGGVTTDKLKQIGASKATLALGHFGSSDAAKHLDNKCQVPCEILDLPIGLQATDRYIDTLRRVARVEVPERLNEERGRLLDLIADMAQYFHGKRVALWGDPDQLVSLTEFLLDINMVPVYIVSGTPGKAFDKRMKEVIWDRVPEVKIANGQNADMFLMHQWIKNEPVDLLIGNTYGKYISRDEDIPLVRHGFPIVDRTGHQYFPTAGYRGAMRLLDQILEALLNRQDRDAPEESFELTM
jgi:nitrogenase molybdenum-iron protein beta chain